MDAMSSTASTAAVLISVVSAKITSSSPSIQQVESPTVKESLAMFPIVNNAMKMDNAKSVNLDSV